MEKNPRGYIGICGSVLIIIGLFFTLYSFWIF